MHIYTHEDTSTLWSSNVWRVSPCFVSTTDSCRLRGDVMQMYGECELQHSITAGGSEAQFKAVIMLVLCHMAAICAAAEAAL